MDAVSSVTVFNTMTEDGVQTVDKTVLNDTAFAMRVVSDTKVSRPVGSYVFTTFTATQLTGLFYRPTGVVTGSFDLFRPTTSGPCLTAYPTTTRATTRSPTPLPTPSSTPPPTPPPTPLPTLAPTPASTRAPTPAPTPAPSPITPAPTPLAAATTTTPRPPTTLPLPAPTPPRTPTPTTSTTTTNQLTSAPAPRVTAAPQPPTPTSMSPTTRSPAPMGQVMTARTTLDSRGNSAPRSDDISSSDTVTTFGGVIVEKSGVDPNAIGGTDQVTGDNGLSITAIGLIVGGGLLLLIVVGMVVAWILTSKRRRRPQHPSDPSSSNVHEIVMPVCSADGFAPSPREQSSMMSARDSQQFDGYTRPPAAVLPYDSPSMQL